MIRIKRGLDIPISGSPNQQGVMALQSSPRRVALLGTDHIGMRPTMQVAEGDKVTCGQVLFTNKNIPQIKYVSPAHGTVATINRGYKRTLLSVVIDVDANTNPNEGTPPFTALSDQALARVTPQQIHDMLLNSGMWVAFRTRPFSKTPDPDDIPHAIFVTAMDTNPLAADPRVVIDEYEKDFSNGILVLSRLIEGMVYVCTAPKVRLDIPQKDNVVVKSFDGPHPAGLAGTHIHFLDPVGSRKTVWTIGYQDVIAIGKLFSTGRLWTERVISLAGPQVDNPLLLRVGVGMDINEICAGRLKEGDNRIISGSILSGHDANGSLSYLGRFHNQISVLQAGRQREIFGWLSPGWKAHSTMGIYLSSFFRSKETRYAMTTTTNGSERAMVPTGNYERVMPLDILPTQLLRALIVGDIDTAQQLGCLELDAEDLALCAYVCSGKYEYAPLLQDCLEHIEKEG